MTYDSWNDLICKYYFRNTSESKVIFHITLQDLVEFVKEENVEIAKDRFAAEFSDEYKIYENGSLMQKYEVEFENERGKTECKFKFEVGGSDGKTEYKLKQENDGEMRIEYKKANLKCKIKVNRTENGYRFVYNNGYVEEISVSENI